MSMCETQQKQVGEGNPQHLPASLRNEEMFQVNNQSFHVEKLKEVPDKTKASRKKEVMTRKSVNLKTEGKVEKNQ